MLLNGITWQAGGTTNPNDLTFLPSSLAELVGPSGGFILHHGALHVRGCAKEPDWNYLFGATHGPTSILTLYPDLDVDDIPFAQDQVGDQYILRGENILHLNAETGDLEQFAMTLGEFLDGVQADIESYLNVGLQHQLDPGFLLHAYPPFCFDTPNGQHSLTPMPTDQLIRFHADLARQIKDVPEGGQVRFKTTD